MFFLKDKNFATFSPIKVFLQNGSGRVQREFAESIDDFEVVFGGANTIDAEIFSKLIKDTIGLVRESANIVDPSCFVRLEIKANEQGSFKTIIDVITKYIPDMLACTSIANEVLQGFVNFLQIKKHLKGRKAKDVSYNDESALIKNAENAVFEVPKNIGEAFFENNKIDQLTIQFINNVASSDRSHVSVRTNSQNIQIDSNNYHEMSQAVVENVYNTVKMEPLEVELALKKPDLLGSSKWEFVYNDKKIEASVLDKKFIGEVQEGEIRCLYAGVKVPCIMQMEYDLNSKGEIVANSDKYTVLEVTGRIIEPENKKQSELF
ncbi:hypothetical protein [Cysteiniphilum halobium]|uniref:hypothetical protein n=1 Tax=Cysteiniphilum halobium TaxID=2219059 RepID=UPI003F859157